MLFVTSRLRICFRALGIFAMIGIVALAVSDAEARKKDSRFERAVSMAGYQRTLAQQLGKETMLVALGIEKEENLRRLRESHGMFQRITRGLRSGDAELGLAATTDPQLLRHIDRVDQLWSAVDRLLTNGISGEEMTPDEVIAVAEMTEPLYGVTDELVKALRIEAQKGRVIFSVNLLAIDYATRQSMLTQKLSKEFLLVAFGHAVEKNRKALERSSQHFDRVLKGLLDGDLQLRLRQAPTPEIRLELQKALRTWGNVAPLVESAANGQPVGKDTIAQISELNLSLLATIDVVTRMYGAL